MIFLVGANSWLVEQLVPVLIGSDKITLVGRSEPLHLKTVKEGDTDSIRFVKTQYRAGENIFRFTDKNERLTLVFAGVGTAPGLIINSDSSIFQTASDSHLVFPLDAVKQALTIMLRAKFGRFIFLGSSQGARGIVGAGMYTTVKAAQRGLSRSIAIEYGRFGVTSNVIDVGFLAGGQDRFLKPSERAAFLSATPSKRPVRVEDVASTIEFVIGNPSVNGAIINVDAAG